MNITVFCGAKSGNKPIYQEKTVELAQWIAKNEHRLIYGGGNNGLMGLLANSVLEEGGEVLGVMPTFLMRHEMAHQNLTEFIEVADMPTRKNYLFSKADAFVALPGGLGTLEEMADVISWTKIGQNNKPCVFYNVANYYDPLAKMLDKMVSEGYLGATQRKNILFSDNLLEIADYIKNYKVVPEFN